jgi:hypothetical protein
MGAVATAPIVVSSLFSCICHLLSGDKAGYIFFQLIAIVGWYVFEAVVQAHTLDAFFSKYGSGFGRYAKERL